MKLSSLLARRSALLRQVRLANLAYAYQALGRFAARIARGGLHGTVVVRPAAPELDRYCATWSAADMSQAVLEEHFSDEELLELADVVAYLDGHSDEVTFRLEETHDRFIAPLRDELVRAGVNLDETARLMA